MRSLNIPETEEWLSNRGIAFVRAANRGGDHRVCIPSTMDARAVLIPREAREQLVLAHQLSRWLDCSEVLLVLTVVTGFTDDEMDVFLKLRRYYGLPEPTNVAPGGDAPGYLFDDPAKESRRTLTEYLFMLLLFNFEGYFVEGGGGAAIWCGDETVETYTRSSKRAVEAKKLFDDLEVAVVEARQRG